MSYIKSILIYLLLLTNLVFAKGQALTVSAKLDSSMILIGDQVLFQYKLVKNSEIQVQLPQIAGQLGDDIVVLQDLGIDSTSQDGKDIITASFLVTAFDSGLFEIPPLPFAITYNDHADTIYTAVKQLFASTLPVDMSKGIVDIKSPFDAPLTFKEMLPWILVVLGVVAIIVLVIYIMKRKKDNKPIISLAKPKEPPHVIALRDLEALRSERLWQQNRIKEYYIRLTDIMRIYLEDRFNFPAMEQTTEEILKELGYKSLITDEELFKSVKNVLHMADLVKFAKAAPLPDENDESMSVALNMVNSTILYTQEEKTIDTEEKKVIEHQKLPAE